MAISRRTYEITQGCKPAWKLDYRKGSDYQLGYTDKRCAKPSNSRRSIDASLDLTPILLIGASLSLEQKLFNCAVAIYRGRVLGITPKTYLPNYREFYEKRQFTSGRDAIGREVRFLGERVPFGNDL